MYKTYNSILSFGNILMVSLFQMLQLIAPASSALVPGCPPMSHLIECYRMLVSTGGKPKWSTGPCKVFSIQLNRAWSCNMFTTLALNTVTSIVRYVCSNATKCNFHKLQLISLSKCFFLIKNLLVNVKMQLYIVV